MAEPFLGQLACIAFNYPPKNWAFCNGQILSIAQNQALFSLLGTTFGGDGRTTFALPNLQGRAPLGVGPGFTLGQTAGEEAHTLNQPEMAAHTHSWMGTSTAATLNAGAGNVVAASNVYFKGAPGGTLLGEPPAVGGGQPHENRSPSLAMYWVIALVGIFPSQN